MEGDTFTNTTKHKANIKSENDNNFFTQSDGRFISISQPEPIRHLNDYDSNILKDGAYLEVNDDIFKLEYKIYRTEEEIKDLEKQIQTANDIHDYYIAQSLSLRKLQLENDLINLTTMYREASISAKISGGLTSGIKTNFAGTKKFFTKFKDVIISKLPKKLASILEIKNSLEKLENINKSLDELMMHSYPYGEAGEKYEQLSKYIARANSIQSEISKFMNK